MNSTEYLQWVPTKDRTTLSYQAELGPSLGYVELRLMHAALGMAGEVGEVVDILKKTVMYHKPLDKVALKEEIGDVLWYVGLLLHTVGSSFEEVMQINHAKLNSRYASGFTTEAATIRADKGEPLCKQK